MAPKKATKAEVLKRVEAAKEQLERIPTPAKRPFGGFVNFVREQGVVGLAIGFILGTESRTLVEALNESFINPLIGLLAPGDGELSERAFDLTFRGQTETFTYGAFLAVLINFLIIAAVVYLIFRVLRLDKLDRKKSA